MKVSEFVKKVATGLSFSEVAAALDGGMANICSYIHEQMQKFLDDAGLGNPAGEHHGFYMVPGILFLATHSIGGREWAFEKGRQPLFFEEVGENGNGWHVCTEADVRFVRLTSATSGSSLAAEKQYDGSWTVTLEVPVRDGEPYRGHYWGAFHGALGLETGAVEETATA